MSSRHNPKGHLLGVGLDNEDGHKRVTRSDAFTLLGGSEETHERMTETVMKTCEDLKRKGRTLDDTNQQELAELIQKNTPTH